MKVVIQYKLVTTHDTTFNLDFIYVKILFKNNSLKKGYDEKQ